MLGELLNYCRNTQGMSKASMGSGAQASFLRITLRIALKGFVERLFPCSYGGWRQTQWFRAPRWLHRAVLDSFLSQQPAMCVEGLGRQLSLGGKAGHILRLQPGSTLRELRLGTESTSVLLHRPFLSRDRPKMYRACSGLALQGHAGRITMAPRSYRCGAAAADRALFEQLRDSHIILSEKNRTLNKTSKVGL